MAGKIDKILGVYREKDITSAGDSTYDNSSSGLIADDVQAAIDELALNSAEVEDTFVDGDLVAGVLTISHIFGLWYPPAFTIYNNLNEVIVPDSVTISTGEITVDLSSFGALTGTWKYTGGDVISAPEGGDVVGPSSSTDSAVALFNGITGKLLKDGVVLGTGANNIVQLDGSAKLPAVDGSQLTGIILPVTALGTSGTVTIDRSISDKWTIEPTSAATIDDSNFTETQEALLIIYNSGGFITFPSDWVWYTTIPVLNSVGYNVIRLTAVSNGAAGYIINADEVAYSTNPVLELLMTGADTSTSFPDTSPYENVSTANGDAQVDTAIKPVGATGSLLIDGTGDFLNTVESEVDLFNVGVNDFTLIFDFYENTNTTTDPVVLSNGTSWGANYFDIRYNSSGNNKITLVANALAIPFLESGVLQTQTWYNVRITRSGTLFTLYIDDVSVDTGNTALAIDWAYGGSMKIGYGAAGGYFNGNVGNVILYNDVSIAP